MAINKTFNYSIQAEIYGTDYKFCLALTKSRLKVAVCKK